MRRIHERLDTLEDELRDLRGRSEVRTASGSTPPAEKTTAAGSENPVRLRNLDDQQLLVETRRLRRKAKDPAGARRALTELLQRSLSPAERAEVFTELGSLERQAGRLQESEAQLHRALSHADPDGDSRAWAGYELALTLTKRGRHPDALAAANDAVAIKGSSKWVRAHCRWAVGTISEKVGNLDSARREYRELLTLIGDDTTFQWCIDDIRARLAAMR